MERFAIGRLELIMFNLCTKFVPVPSVLWRCWLGGRKCIRPVKTVVGCWHGYLSGARCRLHMAQRMPLPLTVSCFGKFQISFNFLVPAHMGSPGHRALKRVCACTKFEVFYLQQLRSFKRRQKCTKCGGLERLDLGQGHRNVIFRQSAYDFLFNFNRNYASILYISEI